MEVAMDPATLGLVAAGLVAKKGLEAAGEKAGESTWGLLGRVGNRVRNWFGDRDDADGLRALELVEAAPDSQRSVEALAACITRAAKSDPDSATDLALLIDAIKANALPEVATFVNNIQGQARVGRIIQVTGTYNEGRA
jgi:hypothetical protein